MKEEKAKEEKPYLQDLFEHMSNEHGLILLQSQMQEIIDICFEQTDYNPLSYQLTTYKEALSSLWSDIHFTDISKEQIMDRIGSLIQPKP